MITSTTSTSTTFTATSPLRWLLLLAGLLSQAFAQAQAADALPDVQLAPTGLSADQLAVVVNDRDPLSRRIGDYYQKARAIPEENIVHVAFEPEVKIMAPETFTAIKAQVDSQLDERVQAYALTWVEPYRVGCQSITAAFAVGFDRRYCAEGCKATARSAYANSRSAAPWTDLAMRPAMLLAAETFDQAKALIDRGVRADGSFPEGTAYLLKTSDKNRTVRDVYFPQVAQAFGSLLDVQIIEADSLKNRDDILFYFTGLKQVPAIAENQYLPGAVADHLTSTGGVLRGGSQMSALRWLEAGATASYGTVVEPCNIRAKFPHPALLMNFYLRGASVIEAYWKSVIMPGQGVFIGEPLAKPFAGYQWRREGEKLRLLVPNLPPGYYHLLGAPDEGQPFERVQSAVPVTAFEKSFLIEPPFQAVYRLEKLNRFGS